MIIRNTVTGYIIYLIYDIVCVRICSQCVTTIYSKLKFYSFIENRLIDMFKYMNKSMMYVEGDFISALEMMSYEKLTKK